MDIDTASELLLWGLVIHLTIDWLLQNEWMATNKQSITYPAGYVHAGLHGVAMMLVFPVWAAALIALLHFVIDTRRPLELWSRVMSQTRREPMGTTVHVWRDQALHVVTIAGVALVAG